MQWPDSRAGARLTARWSTSRHRGGREACAEHALVWARVPDEPGAGDTPTRDPIARRRTAVGEYVVVRTPVATPLRQFTLQSAGPGRPLRPPSTSTGHADRGARCRGDDRRQAVRRADAGPRGIWSARSQDAESWPPARTAHAFFFFLHHAGSTDESNATELARRLGRHPVDRGGPYRVFGRHSVQRWSPAAPDAADVVTARHVWVHATLASRGGETLERRRSVKTEPATIQEGFVRSVSASRT